MHESRWPRVLLCGLLGVLAAMGLAFAVLFLFVLPFHDRADLTIGTLGALNAAAAGLAVCALRRAGARGPHSVPRPSWHPFGEALELAFTASVALTALLLLAAVALGAGWFPGVAPDEEALRLLSATGLVQAAASGAVGVALFLATRPHPRSFATAAVHLASCLFLTIAFFVGS
ncbi:MAG: hypothetical protein ACUVYA_14010 [Planctomycetota bacterium]